MDASENYLFELNKIWNDFDQKYLTKYPGDFLYHYTGSSAAIRGIIENKKLWLSPYNDVNDPSEIAHGMNLSLQLVKNIMQSKNLISEKKAYEELIRLLEVYERLSSQEFFFISFSEAGDADISQWREYGNRGNGFCLEFMSKNSFYDPNREQNILFPLKPLLAVRPIIYKDIEKKNLLNIFFYALNNYILKSGIKEKVLLIMFLRQLCTYFKHEAYAPEKEWRTVILVNKDQTLFNQASLEIVEVGGFFRKKAVLDLPSQKEPLDGINKVTCGPKQNSSKYNATKNFIDKLQIGAIHQVLTKLSDVPMI